MFTHSSDDRKTNASPLLALVWRARAPQRPSSDRRRRPFIRGAREATLLAVMVVTMPVEARPARSVPSIVISTSSHVLELRQADGRRRRFPVGVGRGGAGPRGRWFTGPDAKDDTFYLPRRLLPAFHRGLPFLRLSPIPLRPHRSDPAYRRAAAQPFGLHGPVTPSLLWGAVTAGCVRLRPADLRLVFAYARAHPGMPVRFTRKLLPDPSVGSGAVKAGGLCSEAHLGVRRVRVASSSLPIHDRICGGVDHWYAVPLQGGDVLSVALDQAGSLRLELYGIRAISTIARGQRGFRFRLPERRANRGARYLRVVAPRQGPPRSYTLRLQRLR